MPYSTDIKDYYRRAWGLEDRPRFKYGGSWADWMTNFSDQMTFEEYLQMDIKTKKPHALDEKADGGRIGFADGPPGTIKKSPLPIKKNVGSTSPVYNEATGHIYKRTNKHGTVWSDVDDTKAKKKGWVKRNKKYRRIQIDLLEETNKPGKFDAGEFAEKHKLSMEELTKQAKRLQLNIYKKRMLIAGTTKDTKSVLDWIPVEDIKTDTALSKLSKSGLVKRMDNRIDAKFYDAFGRKYKKGSTTELNPSYDLPKYKAIRKNKNQFEALKRIINEIYPSINFQLDHPLSQKSINALMRGTAAELSRVNVLDQELNQSFKKHLSDKYLESLTSKNGKVNLEMKKAVEKIAKDLNINIGKISDKGKVITRGVSSFEKLNMRDEILKSLKNQQNLSTNFKSYLKNNPDVFKMAGFTDTSKLGTNITKVTNKDIKNISKLLSVEDQTKLSKTIQSILNKKNSGLNVVDIAKWGRAELGALDDIAGKLPSKALSAFGRLLKFAGVVAIPMDFIPIAEARSKGLGANVGLMNLAEIYTNLPGVVWEAGEWLTSKAKGKEHEWKPPYETTFGQEYETQKLRDTPVEVLEENISNLPLSGGYLEKKLGTAPEELKLIDDQTKEALINQMRKEKALADQKKKEEITGVDKYIIDRFNPNV